jgi:hypothetical protein|tara:strand:+ start:924 stop:1409 length:486 start_codon:yes stop_codon:yes gene_type:complete
MAEALQLADSLLYWHPQRFGVKKAPKWFRLQLKGIHQDLDITWHPVRERWLVWYRRPRIQHATSPGWMLLFEAENSQGEHIPLDARILAAVYEQSGMKWGSGKHYWSRVEQESQRATDSRAATRDQTVEDVGADQWDFSEIKISMRGHSNGSKFVNHHAGD